MDKKFQHRWTLPAIIFALCASWGAPTLSLARAQETLPQRDQIYLADLTRLSRIIGLAHGVRVVCNGRDDQYWRTYMQDLLALEAPMRGALRDAMVSAFNDGFTRETRDRRACDGAAVEAEASYAGEGRQLAEALAAFYFPKPDRGELN